MKGFGKHLSLILALALVLTCLPVFAFADTAVTSVSGQTIAVTSGHVYLVLNGGDGSVLYGLSKSDGVLSQLDTASQIDEAIGVGDTAYYLRLKDDAFGVVALDDLGASRELAVFAAGQIAHKLRYYDGALYCLVENKLTQIDLATGVATTVSERLMSDFVISDGMVHYVSIEDTKEYTRASQLEGSAVPEITQTFGTLYAMHIDGTNDTLEFAQGVDSLAAHGGYLYFHNLNDNYVMASDTEEWLEGCLYRLNLADNALNAVLADYDWQFAPCDLGMVVYRATGIELGSLNGLDFSVVYAPEQYTSFAVVDNTLYVYEHTLQKLTAVNLGDASSEVLYTGTVAFDGGDDVAPEPSLDPEIGDEGDATENTGDGEPVQGILPTATSAPLTANQTANATVKTTYRLNDKGAEVLAFQKRLVELKYLGKADGVFGKNTKAAVIAFQTKAGLTVDGVVGPRTLSMLYSVNAPAANKATDSSYLIANSSRAYLTEADVKKLDSSLWSFARNEILARHGYVFQTTSYKNYFANKTWYKAGGYNSSSLSVIEWANIQLIKDMEAEIDVPVEKSKYIFPYSATIKLTRADILAVDADLWAYGRNEILARHGYVFTTAKYKNYFSAKTWYKAGGYSEKSLNEVEWYNMSLLKDMEDGL